MKINIKSIILDHYKTLRDQNTGKTSVVDIAIFIAIPSALALIAYFYLYIRPEVYNASLTFFGIFVGLLINVQVAMFSIFQRKWIISDDKLSRQISEEKASQRNVLLQESNSNISYLILVSSIAAAFCLILYAWQTCSGWGPAIGVGIVTHFFLTLLMVVKRLHALFAKEYQQK